MTTPLPPSDALHRRMVSVCDACGDFIEYWGFKSIHGRIWAYLAISHQPLSQKQLAEALEMSKGSISIAMNELLEYGLVKPSANFRHAPYEAVMDVWPIISGVLREREWMLLETARITLEGAITELERVHLERQREEVDDNETTEQKRGRLSNPEVTFNIDRLRILLQMTEWAQSILKLIINARIPRAPERWGAWMGRAVKWRQSLKSLLGNSEEST